MHASLSSRRQRLSAEERSQLVSLFRASGLSQAQFAQEHRIKLSTFRQWLYRPVPRLRPARFQEMPAPFLATSWAAELALDSGLTLRLSSSASADWIGSVVKALRPC